MTGRSLVGYENGRGAGAGFRGVNPATGAALDPEFLPATAAELNRAAELAAAAFPEFVRLNGHMRGRFLREIAARLEADADAITARAGLETALPPARLAAELGRTCFQLRLFAELVEEGSWAHPRVDHALERPPLPRKPDLRSLLRGIGPVAVFGASNFPLAFSVAGGDTASAFAAGCPVIVKAHHAHPGTSELAAHAVRDAARAQGMPEGVFSMLFGAGAEVGAALVRHPAIRAVGFTGSLAGGRALMDLAAARPHPIPVYAEMGSVNPVFLLPRALAGRGPAIAAGLHASFTLGAGQFCTKPGMVVVESGADADAWVAQVRALVEASPAYTLLTRAIADTYERAATARRGHARVMAVAAGAAGARAGHQATSYLLQTEARALMENPELGGEMFGPATLVVRHRDREELLALAHGLEGHLTATVHGTDEDLRDYADLLAILPAKVGRVVVNGFPTGVEVTHAMVHGGPYPATSDGRSTSVGTQAIYRFTRAVCFQDMPDFALPPELRETNPLGLWRLVDGSMRQP